MILEIAQLQVRPGKAQEFEAAFNQAQKIIVSMPGYGGSAEVFLRIALGLKALGC